MKIGYLGPEGTYTQQATEELVEKLRLSDVEKLPLKSIDDVLESLYKGTADAAVIPLRNSLAGDYAETIRCLKKYDFNTRDSIDLQIKLAFAIHPEAKKTDVREIRSKDTALRECSTYLRKNYPNAQRVNVESTATAMQFIIQQNQRHAAAIGSERGMELYGLKIVDDNIGNDRNNFTTFLYLERRKD